MTLNWPFQATPVKSERAIGLPIYDFLEVFNSKHIIYGIFGSFKRYNLSDLAFNLSPGGLDPLLCHLPDRNKLGLTAYKACM